MKTAIEWLIQNIVEDQIKKAKSMSEWVSIFKQANKMFEEQIINAFDNFEIEKYENGKQYYEQTYGGNK